MGRRFLHLRIVAALVASIVWLLVLPFIPWTAEKALIMDAARLRPSMTTTQVRAIIVTHQGVHTSDGRRFCADGDWKDDACNGNGTVVDVRMESDQLVRIHIDMD